MKYFVRTEGFLTFNRLKKGENKAFRHPSFTMQRFAAVRAACRKQKTPQLQEPTLNGGEGEGFGYCPFNRPKFRPKG